MQVSDALAHISKLPRRERVKIKQQIRQQAGRELARRKLENAGDYDSGTLEQLYRSMCTGDYGGLRFRAANDNDRADHRALIMGRLEHFRGITFADDPEEAIEAEMERCRADFFYWADNWAWGFDPRLEGVKRIPFVMFRRQREMIEFILRKRGAKESCGIKKSRDVGMTVLVALMGVWMWLFDPGTVVTYGSLLEKRVHKIGDPSSIFEKIRSTIEALPNWMLPDKWDFRTCFREFLVVNPETGSVLSGEVGNNMGRGGRANVFFADEFSECDHQQDKHSSISGTADFAVYFGTSAGPTTYFSELEIEEMLEFLAFPWYYDPRKLDNPDDVGNPNAESEWKTKKLGEVGQEIFAQQFACNDDLADAFILIRPEWVSAAERWEPGVAASGFTVSGFDVADGGEDEHVMAIRQAWHVRPLKTWNALRWEQMPPIVHIMAAKEQIDLLNYDGSGIGAKFGIPITERAKGAYKIRAVYAQDKPSNIIYRQFKRPASEIFFNRTTELWFAMADRLQKTYEVVMGDADHPLDELVKLPDDPLLKRQLTSRRYEVVAGGKLKLEDKKKMKKSPDRADALSLTEDIGLELAERGDKIQTHRGAKSRFATLRM